MAVMVALAHTTEPFLKTASCARGQSRSYPRSPSWRANSSPQANLRLAVYGDRIRLGTSSKDPAEDDLNLYRYVKNNPVNEEDPSGLQTLGSPQVDEESGLRFIEVYEGWGWWGADTLGRVIYDPSFTSDESARSIAAERSADDTEFGAFFVLPTDNYTAKDSSEKFANSLMGRVLGSVGALGTGDYLNAKSQAIAEQRNKDRAESYSYYSMNKAANTRQGPADPDLDFYNRLIQLPVVGNLSRITFGEVVVDDESMAGAYSLGRELTISSGFKLAAAGIFASLAKAPVRAADLPWGRVGARQAAKAIEAGQTSIKVASRDDAAEVVWRMFSSRGFTNTTGRTGSDVRNILGSKAGTYHWDDVLDAAGNVAGHGADNVHGSMRHVQIHLYPDGDIIRIFFP